jgi:folate-binding protein YgfZ
MKVYFAPKQVLRLSNHIEDFLQGLSSNRITANQNAFLNVHGKIIAVFEQVRISEDAVVIAVMQETIDDLLEHLDKYIKLSSVKIEQLSHRVIYDLSNSLPVEDQDYCILQREGKLVMTEQDIQSTISDDEFALYRLQNHIPLQGIDFKDDFILNVSMKDYVSFDKGCYLGQEPVSKVSSRSKPTWRLVVKTEENCSEEELAKMTSKVEDPGTGKVTGFVFEKNN